MPSLYPRSPVVPSYWWDGHRNFGDGLTPWLLPRAGVAPVHRSPDEAKLVGVGSILELIPEEFGGVIWGSGLIRDHTRNFPNATVMAVRGRLTHERIGAPDGCAFGDPGILVSRYVKRPATKYALGLVPHGIHQAHPEVLRIASRYPREVRVIDVHQNTGKAVAEIASCEAIITTSLHGLITADSYGIPAAWATLEPFLIGGDFKFHDYESVVSPLSTREFALESGESLTSLSRRARPADREFVQGSMTSLLSSIDGIRDRFSSTERSPLSMWREVLDPSRLKRSR